MKKTIPVWILFSKLPQWRTFHKKQTVLYIVTFVKVLYETDEEFEGFAIVFFISTNQLDCLQWWTIEHSSTPVFSPCLTAVCVEFLGLVVVESVLASVNIKAVFKQRVSDCLEKTLTPSWTHWYLSTGNNQCRPGGELASAAPGGVESGQGGGDQGGGWHERGGQEEGEEKWSSASLLSGD